MRTVPYRLLFFLAALLPLGVYAAAVTIPNLFTAGEMIVAADVNENFTALETAVSDLESTLASLQSEQPGIATAFSEESAGIVATGADYLSVAIDVPAAGVVKVRGEAMGRVQHANGNGLSWIRISVADVAGEIDLDNIDYLLVESTLPSGDYGTNLATTLVDRVDSAGYYTYYVNADTSAENPASAYLMFRRRLIATYYPTTIGNVVDTNLVTPPEVRASPEGMGY